MRLAITGANGFVGRHLVQTILDKTDWTIISIERPKSANLATKNDRILRFFHDFRAPLQDSLIADLGKVDIIIHNGAEVHAIRSLSDPKSFVQSNCVGVFNMLEAARKLKPQRFIYCSSAEVFGPAPTGYYHSEDAALNPSNPYSAAKAGGEMLCCSYFKSFHAPVNIVRTMNLFGETQDDTKFVPMVVKKALNHETLKVHFRNGVIGTRQWIYVKNYVSALLHILQIGIVGQSYNVPGIEKNNVDIISNVQDYLDCPIKFEPIEAPPTHDIRYAISGDKLFNLGWNAPIPFHDGMKQTVTSLKGQYASFA